jgi:hypothetical protein
MASWIRHSPGWLRTVPRDTPQEHPAVDPAIQSPTAIAPQQYAIKYFPLQCPLCGTKKPKTYSTRLPVRYHKCRNPKCGISFKSIEQKVIFDEKPAQKVVTTL